LINVEPQSIKFDELIVESVHPESPQLLRDHFYPSQSPSRSGFDLSLIPYNVQFKFNPDYVDKLPKFTISQILF